MQHELAKKLLVPVLDLVFPKSCISCGRGGAYACDECFDLVSFNSHFICSICHSEISLPGQCPNCPSGLIDSLVYAYYYKHPLIAETIKISKYDYIKELSVKLGQRLAMYMSQLQDRNVLSDNYDLIIPVPLHPKRYRLRAFNQAEIIAKQIGQIQNVPIISDAVVRIRHTNPQARLLANKRFSNIDKAFEVIAPQKISGKSILIVDDLVTTGATFQALAKALRQAGAKSVYAAAVAKN
ncbi:MAG: hypothetical protein COT81_03685 [Candidatus Buchananbacteria bacterium CG10_big_fil_rev_8_21_14_0_10_42_9]|uniref:Phosphoribosyltransferase domain-containing protein n=1 Tax=Candidatus Buchananbacteria bacterium CG10_big_fil_rev_8_21_14_0_10_42_9 TaxID=1974526 RepID=A0A2H0W0Q5_9BACT|nr:MAG: hypothetical protein COT81_03685 [Candidatus Buchananbacteria bacterium CG10_big_fil_rev_8_21_14_0_10_42_9]